MLPSLGSNAYPTPCTVRIRSGPSLRRSALMWESTVRVPLAATPRTVLTRERLLAEVWDWVDASGTRTVDSHIKALRRKLGPDLIRTVHGVGYAFEPPVA